MMTATFAFTFLQTGKSTMMVLEKSNQFLVKITLLARHSSTLEKGMEDSPLAQIQTIHRHSNLSGKCFIERGGRQLSQPLFSAVRM